LLAALMQRYPRARVHLHHPLRPVAQLDGARAAFGRALLPLLHLERARCVLALAADPFSDGPGAVRCAMDWASARDIGRTQGRLPRLFAAEIAPGLFGARADMRVALPPARIEALLWRIAAAWLERPA